MHLFQPSRSRTLLTLLLATTSAFGAQKASHDTNKCITESLSQDAATPPLQQRGPVNQGVSISRLPFAHIGLPDNWTLYIIPIPRIFAFNFQ